MEDKKKNEDEIHEQINFDDKVKVFFSNGKNVAIVVLSILVILLAGADTGNTSDKALPVSVTNNMETDTVSQELKEATEEVANLKKTNEELTQKNQELTSQINSMASVEDLQNQVTEKSNYIFNLEEQVGVLTAEKTQLESQIGILQQQIKSSSSSSSSSSSASTSSSTPAQSSTSYTVYVTNTGSKYHRSGCSYLRNSSRPIDKDTAVSQGYTPCSRCNP